MNRRALCLYDQKGNGFKCECQEGFKKYLARENTNSIFKRILLLNTTTMLNLTLLITTLLMNKQSSASSPASQLPSFFYLSKVNEK